MSILFCSCKKENKEIEHDYLETAIDKLNVNNDIKWMVILPGLGCPGCIQEGETFVKENIKNKSILFVLTKIESFKILQNKLEVKFNEHPNVYIDKKEEIVLPTGNRIYPCIVKLNKGKVVTHEFQSPNNGAAFHKLKRKIIKESK